MYRKCNSRTPREQNMFRISLPSEWTETRQRGPPQGRNNQGRQDWETRLGDKAATNLKEYSCWTSGSHSLRSKNPYSWRYLGNNWSGCAKQYWKALVAVSKGAQKCPHVYIYVYIVKESRIIFTSSITCIHIATENFCLLEGTDLQMDLTFCNPMTLVVFHPLCQCVQYDPILK
jgi:hypothetical protein